MFRRSRTQTKGATKEIERSRGDVAHAPGGFTAPTGGGLLDDEVSDWLHRERQPLGDIVLEIGALTEAQLDEATQVAAARDGRLDLALRELGSLDERTLARCLALQFEVPFADLRDVTPADDAVALVGEELARRHRALPLRIEGDRTFVALADPLDAAAIVELTKQCSRIAVEVGAPSDISLVLDRTFSALREADRHIAAFTLAEEPRPVDETTLEVDENSPIVQVVNRIITQGVRSRASDIHVEAHDADVRVRYRIDGALSDAIRLPVRMGAPISSRIKVLADLNIVERRRPQDGQFSLVVDQRPIDIRTSVVPTVHGEKIVLRLLDKTRSLIGLADLGMPPDVVRAYSAMVRAPLGMVLCTGPTGSGKTTTLYATLMEINDPAKNLVTIEDPVEYQFDGVNQMPVHEHGGISFADGLRGILRQDPDIILVGEIRDVETARIATQAALTGHFVLSSLHAVDASSALHRLGDMGIEPFLIASALSGIVGQRLLRRVCNSCRAEYTPPPEHIRAVAENADHLPKTWTRGEGCQVCSNTGYSGRVGVYELLQVNDTLREMIVNRASGVELREEAIAGGMRTMQAEAFDLVAEGVTTVDEVFRSVYGPTADIHEVRSPAALPPGRRAIESPPASLEAARPERDDDDDHADNDLEVSA